jgi:hypothetical protein
VTELHPAEWINIVLATITAIYAIFTFKILKANKAVVAEMRNQQEATVRPYISVSTYLQPGSPLFYLRVKNVGKTTATSLNLSLDRDFYQLGDKREERNLAIHPAFTNTIHSMPPDSELVFILASGQFLYSEQSKEITPLLFTVTATYSIVSKVVTEKTVIDLHPYIGTILPRNDIVGELIELRKSVDKIAENCK